MVPVHFHGQNSRLFHVASAVSDSLRAALLLHEARNKLGRRFRVSVGRTIDYATLEFLLARVAARCASGRRRASPHRQDDRGERAA